MHIKDIVLWCLMINVSVVFANQIENSPCSYAFQYMRPELALFIDNVLHQVPSATFFAAIDAIALAEHPHDDVAWYHALTTHRSKLLPLRGYAVPWHLFAALRHQKRVLSSQIVTLLGSRAGEVTVALEIGKPATYLNSVRSQLPSLRMVYAVNDAQSVTDRIEAGLSLCKPYDSFVALSDYAPLTHTIPQGSVDLIVCTIGFHHIPAEKLEPFVVSLRGILRPGGMLILRDHEANSPERVALASAAHTVFNLLVTREPLERERAEVRNFQPLDYWVKLLERHGFLVGHERLLQEGDSTGNTMLMATAVPSTVQEQAQALHAHLMTKPGYHRDSMQTHLTSPEWLSVDIAQEYGAFINHTPFYEFPWMKSLSTYWKVFFSSCRAAIARRGVLPVVTSPYLLMNAFIGVMTTVEHGAKAAISAPIRWMYAGAEPEELQVVIYDPEHERHILGAGVTVIREYQHDLVCLKVPRYKQFLALVKRLSDVTSLRFMTIAGNEVVQCKVRARGAAFRQIATELPGVSLVGEWEFPTQPGFTYANIMVPVQRLKQALNWFERHECELLYVHDF